MSSPLDRREFVSHSLKAGLAAGLGDLAFMSQLPPVSAADVKATPAVVPVGPDVEPLVRLIEDTPRAKLLEAVGAKVHEGTSYGRLLGALLLAGVRGIKPRPVGFKFHAVLVVNSAHLASLAAPDSDRWLPLFWALDNYKVSQAKNKEESGGWMMPPVAEAKLPSGTQAKKRFVEAMDRWDEEGADAAVAALVRSGPWPRRSASSPASLAAACPRRPAASSSRRSPPCSWPAMPCSCPAPRTAAASGRCRPRPGSPGERS